MRKLCQGPSLPYNTIRPTGNEDQKETKVNQTRTVSGRGYGNGDFCTLGCQDDWWAEHVNKSS